MDWYDLKFLESPKNLKSFIKESIGKEPSTSTCAEIASCLQQGRLFFETAAQSPIEIKPLQVFYGLVGFSKAIACARNLTSTRTLVPSHGLQDKSDANAVLENTVVLINSKGTFQHFNDAICNLECFNAVGLEHEAVKMFSPYAKSSVFANKSITLKTILSRCPCISNLYNATFADKSACLPVSFFQFDSEYTELRLDVATLFNNRESLKRLIDDLRDQFIFLKGWSVSTAERCYGNSIIIFSNTAFDIDAEFSEDWLVDCDGKFSRKVQSSQCVNFASLLPPLSGGITKEMPCYISPIDGAYISQSSLMYLGLFLLSSLVRYRPDVWGHCITGKYTAQRPSDDHCMAMVESLLNHTLSFFPGLVVNAIKSASPQ